LAHGNHPLEQLRPQAARVHRGVLLACGLGPRLRRRRRRLAGRERQPDASGSDGGSAGSGWSCERGCELALEADCPMGPPSQAQCVADCEQNLAGDCGAEYEALMRCAEGEAISCRDDGFLVIAACGTEQDAFIACAN
jgi:hypothetical protein